MSTQKVASDYAAGMASFNYLFDMLGIAIAQALPNMSIRIAGGYGYRGFNLKNGTYWCGVRYGAPELLVFEDNFGYSPKFKHDLDLRACDFYNLEKDQQLETLVSYVCRAGELAGERQPTV